MNALQDRRLLALAGAGVALLAGVLIAVALLGRDETAPAGEAASDNGGLQVEMSADLARMEPGRELRCFVGGQYIGMATLSECAERNGVAAQALDVGLDESGELAAGDVTAQLQPLPSLTPPTEVAVAEPPRLPPLERPVPVVPSVPAAGPPTNECLRYGADGWRSIGGAVSLNACVQILFSGRCQRAGEALYGRWGGQTLRLVPGRVEASGDNRNFQPLVDQARDCGIPQL